METNNDIKIITKNLDWAAKKGLALRKLKPTAI